MLIFVSSDQTVLFVSSIVQIAHFFRKGYSEFRISLMQQWFFRFRDETLFISHFSITSKGDFVPAAHSSSGFLAYETKSCLMSDRMERDAISRHDKAFLLALLSAF